MDRSSAVLAGEADADIEHPSVAYMREVGEDFLNANRLGTVASFMRAITRHADIGSIGMYSLGTHAVKLSDVEKEPYMRGVATFMARYFSSHSRSYRIAHYEIDVPTIDQHQNIIVAVKIFTVNGHRYRANFRLIWTDGRYRVADVKIFGLSLVYLQRGLFITFLNKHDGDIGQLIAILNR